MTPVEAARRARRWTYASLSLSVLAVIVNVANLVFWRIS